MIGNDLLRYQKEQKYCWFDTETFNLNLMADNPPWQISWILGTIVKIEQTANNYLSWGSRFRMSEGARIVTGFRQETIDKFGRDPKEVFNEILAVISDEKTLLVAHNLFGFDYHILSQLSKYVGGPSLEFILPRCIDTNCLAKAIKLGLKPSGDILAFQLKLSRFYRKGMKTSLGALTKEYQLQLGQEKFHAAEFDIMANREIFKKQLWEIEV